jgi:iron complex outermembrane recepter protein
MGSNLNYYFNANVANDDGWADHNSSRLRQAFGKLRYTDANTTLSLSAGGADNDLLGSQTIPRSFLGNPRQAYTFPAQNQNNVGYVTLSCDHYFNDHVELSENVYYRHSLNSNVSRRTSPTLNTQRRRKAPRSPIHARLSASAITCNRLTPKRAVQTMESISTMSCR